MTNWRNKNRTYWLWAAAKRRAKRDGLEFDLDWKEIVIPDRCPVFNIELFVNPIGTKGACPNSPTLDRIDSSKGYLKSNVCVISWKANKYKSDMDIETIEKLLKYMKQE